MVARRVCGAVAPTRLSSGRDRARTAPVPPDRADRLRRLRGEARRGPAGRGAGRSRCGSRGGARCAHRGPRPARRRGRLPSQRRPRDHRHARLLPAARRRPADVRRDRGRERPVGRVRDGRPSPVRPVDRGIPRGAATRRAGGHLRRRVGEGARGGRHARRRSHDPRPRAQVRARGHRRRPSRSPVAQGRRRAGRPARADETARHGPPRVGPSPGPDPRPGSPGCRRRDAPSEPCRLGRAGRRRRPRRRPT